MSADRGEYIAGLRALADVLEADDTLTLPFDGTETSRLDVFVETREQAVAWARVLPGRKDKRVTEDGFYDFQLLGALHGLHVRVYAPRDEVCTRVVTGTREVTKTVPAPDAPMIEVTETVEDVEWICEPLLALASEATA